MLVRIVDYPIFYVCVVVVCRQRTCCISDLVIYVRTPDDKLNYHMHAHVNLF